MKKSWNCVFEFLWEPCLVFVRNVVHPVIKFNQFNVLCCFQHYFSYIVVLSGFHGGNSWELLL